MGKTRCDSTRRSFRPRPNEHACGCAEEKLSGLQIEDWISRAFLGILEFKCPVKRFTFLLFVDCRALIVLLKYFASKGIRRYLLHSIDRHKI